MNTILLGERARKLLDKIGPVCWREGRHKRQLGRMVNGQFCARAADGGLLWSLSRHTAACIIFRHLTAKLMAGGAWVVPDQGIFLVANRTADWSIPEMWLNEHGQWQLGRLNARRFKTDAEALLAGCEALSDKETKR